MHTALGTLKQLTDSCINWFAGHLLHYSCDPSSWLFMG